MELNNMSNLVSQIELSESEYVLTIFKRYWKILLKWIFRIHGLPEITSDKLFERINSGQPPLLIDIRAVEDFNGARASEYGHIPNSRNIDILELETLFQELEPYKDREIVTLCTGGGLSLAAVEILANAGFKDVKSLKGGTDLWHKKGYPTTRDPTKVTKTKAQQPSLNTSTRENEGFIKIKVHKTLDARGMTCPMPMLKSRVALNELEINQVLEIRTTDPGSIDSIPKWAVALGQELVISEELGPSDFRFLVKRLK